MNLKAFAGIKFPFARILMSVFHRIENIVGNGQNAVNKHFLLHPQCFLMLSVPGSLKLGIVWQKVNVV